MNRRQVLASGCAGVGICLGGLLVHSNPTGESDTVPVVAGEELELTPGEKTTATFRVDDAGSVRVSSLPESESVVFDVNDASFSDSPVGQDDADPPYWNWSPPESSVEISVPIRVPDRTTAGEYRYAVTAWPADVERGPDRTRDDANAETESFPITVTDN